ncbi:MAG: RNA-binding S4 domain-containing protein [Clostridia bacterium]|jgi:ribosomal 50S subunit-recycling heat shock protein|nr:RNA-binding S4 domain-containing protein [Clostridia bacterium]
MRLDKYLKVARIIKRRTVANDACDTSHVSVNGRPAKASYDVKENDIIAITFGERTLTVRVLSVKEHVTKADAASMYEVVEG